MILTEQRVGSMSSSVLFETMDCAEQDQVRLTVYQLKGSAHEWWRAVRQTSFQGRRLDQIAWERFLEVFHNKYFPDYACCERRDQFHELTQGKLTVACTERFISGLRSELRWAMAGHLCDTLAVAVARATALERECWFQPQQGEGSARSTLYQRRSGSRGSVSSSSSLGTGGGGLTSKMKLFTRGGRRRYQ
ncbi:hypothetical protein Taro_021574 [Colocasia esculenta]|uniref:Retrotransposon gag domain-containing protein n=1 Tax=Colocasia esculenta TaxID=4460 RepID=A0A843V5D9_COLES|nr:hypothetical protein [Colocasia esculenta]